MQWVPDTCALPTEQVPLRVEEFGDVLSRLRDLARPDRWRLALTFDAAEEATVRDLAARESACCSFFAFTFNRDDVGALELVISVPAGREAVLDGLERQARAVRP